METRVIVCHSELKTPNLLSLHGVPRWHHSTQSHTNTGSSDIAPATFSRGFISVIRLKDFIGISQITKSRLEHCGFYPTHQLG